MANGNLFITYGAGPPADNGSRPIPSGPQVPAFWANPGLGLVPGSAAQDPSTYYESDVTQNTPANPETVVCPIAVQVSCKNDTSPTKAYQSIGVEVLVCDASTAVTSQTALAFDQRFPNAIVMQGSWNQTDDTWPLTIPITQLYPYAGFSATKSGHVCLIGNCFGVTTGNDTSTPDDGDSWFTALANIPPPVIDFQTLVQMDGHAAQHNIFVTSAPAQQDRPRISFPFNAVLPLERGSESVILELQHPTGAEALTHSDLAFLKAGPYKHLPLHVSKVPVVDKFRIHGCDDGPGRTVKQHLHAGKPLPLTVELELQHGETAGGVHCFNVVQKTAAGQVQGGLRLLMVISG